MNRRILLVEDNPDDVTLAARAFRKHRFDVELLTASSAEQGLELLAEERRPPRLVLLDLQLPKMSGLEFLRRLRESQTTRLLPVVVMTCSDEEQDVRAAYNCGANSYLRKPVDFGDFSAMVGQLHHYWLELNRVPRHA